MQYILSQEEFEALAPVEHLKERDEALEQARQIIVELAGVRCGVLYCDVCPVSDIYRGHSGEVDAKISKLICPKTRHYSK